LSALTTETKPSLKTWANGVGVSIIDSASYKSSDAAVRVSIELDTSSGRNQWSTMGALPGMLVHGLGGVVGVASVGVGFAVGKMFGAVTGGTIADSPTFRMATEAFLATNGIFPTVYFETESGEIRTPPSNEKEYLRHLRSTPLIVSNHVSYLDALVLPLTLGWPRFIAKEEIKGWPIFGTLGRELDAVWVERDCPASRRKAHECIHAATSAWREGSRPLMVFPEGTTTNGKGLAPFKKGAFAPGLTVRPVLIKYTGSWDPSNTNFRLAEEQPTEGGDDGPKGPVPYTEKEWAMQFAGHIVHTMTVLVCKAYEPTIEEIQNAQLFASNIREDMLYRLEDLHSVYDKGNSWLRESQDEICERWRRLRHLRRRAYSFPAPKMRAMPNGGLPEGACAASKADNTAFCDPLGGTTGGTVPSLHSIARAKLRDRRRQRQMRQAAGQSIGVELVGAEEVAESPPVCGDETVGAEDAKVAAATGEQQPPSDGDECASTEDTTIQGVAAKSVQVGGDGVVIAKGVVPGVMAVTPTPAGVATLVESAPHTQQASKSAPCTGPQTRMDAAAMSFSFDSCR